jgi:hypothetical protein
MRSLKYSIVVLCLFLLCISMPSMGNIPNNEYNDILTLAKSVSDSSLTDYAISSVSIDGNTNTLLLTYYPKSANVQKAREGVLAFYMFVHHDSPSINGCQYTETDISGNIVGMMYTRPEWYNELEWLSDTRVTDESLINFITQTISTFQSDSQSEPESLPNAYVSPQSSTRQPSSDCLTKCEEYNIGQKERNDWRLDHGQIEWPLMDCSQKCG